MGHSRSKKLFQLARELIPGGVNSPVRAFAHVGGNPLFIDHASGAYLTDVDGNSFIDYVGSWGPMIAGHAHPKVLEAIFHASLKGTSFGAPCLPEQEMASWLTRRIPSLQKVRMVNSGTEAVLGALRTARGFTGRDLVLKFSGGYHGHADYLLVKAGSGALTTGRPDSLGIPKGIAATTVVSPYNNLEATARIAKKNSKNLAAIIVEPIAGNMGCVLPLPGFLQGLKKLCRETGALLVFDEVMTGFRVHPAGAQGLFGIRPDLTALGKIIGGGLPVGAYGGRKDVMHCVSPEGKVYQAGTLSGNPLAMAAGLANLKLVSAPATYTKLLSKTDRLARGLAEAAEQAKLKVSVPYACGMFSLFFSPRPPRNLAEVQETRTELFAPFFQEMLRRGVYLPPSPYEAWFVSLAHGENEIAKTLRAAKVSFQLLKRRT